MLSATPLEGALAAAAAWLAVAALSLLPAGNSAFARRVAFPLGALAGVALAGFGLEAIWLPAQQMTLPLGLPELPFHLRIDPLAGFFLMRSGRSPRGFRSMRAAFSATRRAAASC